MRKQYFLGYFSFVLLGRKLENLFRFSFSGTRNVVFGTLKIGQNDPEIPNLEFESHGFLQNHVFLPTEQAETNICWINHQDATFKICLSLFGWRENILPKMYIVHWEFLKIDLTSNGQKGPRVNIMLRLQKSPSLRIWVSPQFGSSPDPDNEGSPILSCSGKRSQDRFIYLTPKMTISMQYGGVTV